MAASRIGIWRLGAKGGIATTAITDLLALQKRLIGTAGLITATPRFETLDLVDWDDFVIGGHDIRAGALYDEALRMYSESRAIDIRVLRAVPRGFWQNREESAAGCPRQHRRT